MSAWKKLCRNTCVKKISTPFSASLAMSVPRARSSSTRLTMMPWMRSMTMTLAAAVIPVHLRHVQQASNPRSCASAARHCRPRASGRARRVWSCGIRRTTSTGRSRRPSSQYWSASCGERVQHLEIALDHLAHAGPQHLDDDLLAAPAASPRAPARSRPPPAARTRSCRTAPRAAGRKPASMAAIADRAVERRHAGPGACASSSAMSTGSRSRRVDSAWPNLTKIGPSSSSARRSRSPRVTPRLRWNQTHGDS